MEEDSSNESSYREEDEDYGDALGYEEFDEISPGEVSALDKAKVTSYCLRQIAKRDNIISSLSEDIKRADPRIIAQKAIHLIESSEDMAVYDFYVGDNENIRSKLRQSWVMVIKKLKKHETNPILKLGDVTITPISISSRICPRAPTVFDVNSKTWTVELTVDKIVHVVNRVMDGEVLSTLYNYVLVPELVSDLDLVKALVAEKPELKSKVSYGSKLTIIEKANIKVDIKKYVKDTPVDEASYCEAGNIYQLNIDVKELNKRLNLSNQSPTILSFLKYETYILDIENMRKVLAWKDNSIQQLITILNGYGKTVLYHKTKDDVEYRNAIKIEGSIHDDLTMMSIALVRECVIITKDKFSEFRSQWCYCKRHDRVIYRTNDTCVDRSCTIELLRNLRLYICSMILRNITYSYIEVSLPTHPKLFGSRANVKYTVDRIMKLNNDIVPCGLNEVQGVKNDFLYQLIKDKSIDSQIAVLGVCSSNGISMWYQSDRLRTILLMCNSLSDKDIEDLKDKLTIEVTVVNDYLTIINHQNANQSQVNISSMIRSPLTKLKLQTGKTSVILDKAEVTYDMFSTEETELDMINVKNIAVTTRLLSRGLCILRTVTNVRLARLGKTLCEYIKYLNADICELTNLKATWYQFGDKKLRGSVTKIKSYPEMTRTPTAPLEITDAVFNAKGLGWPIMLDIVTSELAQSMTKDMSLSFDEFYKKYRPLTFSTVFDSATADAFDSAFEIKIEEEIEVVSSLDALHQLFSLAYGGNALNVSVFDTGNEITRTVRPTWAMDASAETIAAIDRRIALGSEKVVTYLYRKAVYHLLRMISECRKGYAFVPFKYLSKYNIGSSWPKQGGICNINWSAPFARIIMSIVPQGNGETSVMYVANLISPTVVESFVRSINSPAFNSWHEAMEQRGDIIDEKAMEIAREIPYRIEELVDVKRREERSEPLLDASIINESVTIDELDNCMATILAIAGMCVSISEVSGIPLIDLVAYNVIASFFSFKGILYRNMVSKGLDIIGMTTIIERNNFEEAIELKSVEALLKSKQRVLIMNKMPIAAQHMKFHKIMLELSRSVNQYDDAKRMVAKYVCLLPMLNSVIEVTDHCRVCASIDIEVKSINDLIKCARKWNLNCMFSAHNRQQIMFEEAMYDYDRQNNEVKVYNQYGVLDTIPMAMKRSESTDPLPTQYIRKNKCVDNIITGNVYIIVLMPKQKDYPKTRMVELIDSIKALDNAAVLNYTDYETPEDAFLCMKDLIETDTTHDQIMIITDDRLPSLLKIMKVSDTGTSCIQNTRGKVLAFPDRLLFNVMKWRILDLDTQLESFKKQKQKELVGGEPVEDKKNIGNPNQKDSRKRRNRNKKNKDAVKSKGNDMRQDQKIEDSNVDNNQINEAETKIGGGDEKQGSDEEIIFRGAISIIFATVLTSYLGFGPNIIGLTFMIVSSIIGYVVVESLNLVNIIRRFFNTTSYKNERR